MNRASSATGWVRNPDGTLGWTWNPITGCLNGCEYCYARKLANGRLKQRYLANENVPDLWALNSAPFLKEMVSATLPVGLTDPFYPRFWPERLRDIERPPYPFSAWVGNAPMTKEWLDRQPPNYHARRKKVGIFTCDMGDLFGIGVPEDWTRQILDAISVNGVDRFYLLTKQPQNLPKWSPFPENCYVGVTACNFDMMDNAILYLDQIEAKVKYISIEPFLGEIPIPVYGFGVDWLIIGALTGTKYKLMELSQQWNIQNINQGLTMMPYGKQWTLQPSIEWAEEIVRAADKAGIPVCLKDNLRPLFKSGEPSYWAIDNSGFLRQEIPE